MNVAFDEVIGADNETRAGLFATTAQRLGTTPQNAEKDFWVCWTIDALFNGRDGGPRLLFKGGTSLSKGFGLIQRFSEDVDVTVFRADLGTARASHGHLSRDSASPTNGTVVSDLRLARLRHGNHQAEPPARGVKSFRSIKGCRRLPTGSRPLGSHT